MKALTLAVLAAASAAAQNWNFEQGRTGWTAPAGNQAFLESIVRRDPNAAAAPRPPASMPLGGDYWVQEVDRLAAPDVGNEGEWLCDTATATPGVQGRYLQRTGVLVSPPFAIKSTYIQFLIAGLGNSTEVHVRLEVKPATDEQRRMVFGQPDAEGFFRTVLMMGGPGPTMTRRVWDATPYRGMTARIVIQDASGAGYLAVDDFRFTDSNVPLPAPQRAALLWGLADTHAHPMATMAFNGIYFDFDSQGDCTPVHGFAGTGLRNGAELASMLSPALIDGLGILLTIGFQGVGPGILRLVNDVNVTPEQIGRLAVNGVDANLGHRTDLGARFNSRTHNHMTESGIRRAYDGGLRLMVAHAVETEVIAQLRPGAVTPRVSIYRQLDAIKAMAARNASWMEVALTPADARRIVGANRLALVLGAEMDTLGDMGPCVMPTNCVAATEQNALAELGRLQAAGVRHLFPIHLADNVFGGSTLYEDMFDLNSWLLNGNMHQVEDGTAQGIQYKSFAGMIAAIRKIGLNIPDLQRNLTAKGLSPLPLKGGWSVDLARALGDMAAFDRNFGGMGGHVNRNGLTALGEIFIRGMMDQGMIIDIDHMSAKSAARTLALTANRNGEIYPAMAGHTSFRALSWQRDNALNPQVPAHKWPSEGNMGQDLLVQLMKRGGMVSPITVGADTMWARGPVANDAPGTSKSWAQGFLHASRTMGGRNVGIATDMALNGGLGPRFGLLGIREMDGDYARALAASREQARAGYAVARELTGAQLENGDLKGEFIRVARRNAIQMQTSAVRYDTPLRSWLELHRPDDSLYRFDGDGALDNEERDAYYAIALHRAGKTWRAIEQIIGRENAMPERGLVEQIWRGLNNQHPLGKALDGRRKWIINVAKGLDGVIEAPLLGDAFQGPPIQRAARDVQGGREANSEEERYHTAYRKIATAWAMITALDRGTNAPLKRYATATHEYDFNLDGLSTYGLLPDLLQDLHNTGMSARDMAPLFRSAEDYIQLWERADRLKKH